MLILLDFFLAPLIVWHEAAMAFGYAALDDWPWLCGFLVGVLIRWALVRLKYVLMHRWIAKGKASPPSCEGGAFI